MATKFASPLGLRGMRRLSRGRLKGIDTSGYLARRGIQRCEMNRTAAARRRMSWLVLAFAMAVVPATARAPQTVILTADAPVFVTANANQPPLRVGKQGSVLRFLDATNGWIHVEFEDPQLGRRAGYVQQQFARISTSEQQRLPLSPPS